MSLQPSAIIQGLSKSDFYSHLMNLRKIMADKKISIWMNSELSSDEPTPDTRFLFSLLESLYDEKVCDTAKCHLLILIEEHFDVFITTASMASELVTSLLGTADNQSQEKRNSAATNYHGYLYQCITAIIVRFNLLQHDSEMCERFVQILFDLLCSVRSGSQHSRFRAIISLEHLEQRYPTFLMWKLEQLVQVCKADFTILYEHCLRLFTLALRNAVNHCVTYNGKWNPDLFFLRNESLRHCQVDFKSVEELRRRDFESSNKRCLADSNGELLTHVHYCLDRMKFLSTWSLVAIFDNLVNVVVRFDDMAASLFKTITLRTMPVNMPRLLFSMIKFRIIFGDSLYKEHTASLLHTCLSHMNNARNTIPHRLLTSHWLAKNVALMEDERQSVNTHMMVPTVFDPLDVKYAKMNFLNSFLDVDKAESSVLLLTNIIGMRKLSQYSGPGRVTTALFQILFQLYLHRYKTTLASDIQNLVLGITKENAEFVPYTLDFVDSIHEVLPDSVIPTRCAAEISDWACDNILDVVDTPAALHYMRILAHSIKEHSVLVAPVVEVMQQLLSDTNICADGDWTKGNALLDICRSMMEHRGELSAGTMFHGLAEVLSAIGLQFNNLDVRQRAELYYSLLLHLNGPRLEMMLAASHCHSQGDVVLQKTEGYPILPEVRLIEWPVFELRNVPIWSLPAPHTVQRALWSEEDDVSLDSYFNFIQSQAAKQPLVLSLSRSNESLELGVLFGIEFACETNCDKMSIEMKTSSCVSMRTDAILQLYIEVDNMAVDTFDLNITATFTAADLPSMGHSPSIRLDIKDLMQSLPIASKQTIKEVVHQLRNRKEMYESFMTLQLDGDQKEWLLTDMEHLLVEEGHYCGLLLPNNHVLVDIEDKGGIYFISIMSDRPSSLKHLYQYLSSYVTQI